MSGLITQFAGPVALPATIALPPANAVGGPSLAVFIDLMMGKVAPPSLVAKPAGDERQDDAAPGNSLPVKDDRKIDSALAWLFAAPQTLVPPPVPVTVRQGAAIAAPLTPVSPQPEPVSLPIVAAIAPKNPDAPIAIDIAAPVPQSLPLPTAPTVATSAAMADIVAPVSQIAPDAVGPQKTMLAAAPNDTPRAAAHPATPPIATLVAAANAQNAPVVLPALFALAKAIDPAASDRDDPAAPPPPAAAGLQSTAAVAIAQTGDAQRQTLDMGQRNWPQKMIDRIETLRDNANANDTSIRLKPEALGRVDVALRTHADGAISVRFTAEQSATRALIAAAAPQLTAAAEARGIRLSGTSVDLASQGGDPRPQREVERRQPITNHLAASSGDDTEAVTDGRLA